jgi:hypothetical protein
MSRSKEGLTGLSMSDVLCISSATSAISLAYIIARGFSPLASFHHIATPGEWTSRLYSTKCWSDSMGALLSRPFSASRT